MLGPTEIIDDGIHKLMSLRDARRRHLETGSREHFDERLLKRGIAWYCHNCSNPCTIADSTDIADYTNIADYTDIADDYTDLFDDYTGASMLDVDPHRIIIVVHARGIGLQHPSIYFSLQQGETLVYTGAC